LNLQACAEQNSHHLQEPQTAPLFPHCESLVPAWHAPLAQHPFGQLEGPQAGLLQVPLMHCSPVLQTAQVPPFLPQAEVELPPLQVLPEQQPTQVVGPQVVEQAWETHFSVPLQTLHAAPPLPHALCCVPDWH
jgi:hypothetical protein